jgi:hypothetical protein
MQTLRTLKVFWAKTPGGDHKLSNFGDILTPVIFSHYNIPFVYADLESTDTLSTGSIAKNARPGTVVLGSGAMNQTDYLCPDANWIWVRGPRTRNLIVKAGGQCGEIYGDPGLLLPKIFSKTQVDQTYDVGIVPHVRHFKEAQEKFPDKFIINLATTQPIEVLKEILKCKKIISSSLHGIVVAHAYGIPAAWIKFTQPIAGDDTKFYDHYESVGISATLSTVDNLNFSTTNFDSKYIEEILKYKDFV